MKISPSFTLIELLVVIGILAALTAATVVVLNPSELLAESRDSVRLSDLRSLNEMLFIYTTQRGEPGGNQNYVYLSLPDNNVNCSSYSLPGLPAPYQYSCVTEANLRKINGSGWIPVDFSSIPGGSPIPTLPVDPANSVSYYYTYMSGGSYEITALLESERYLKSSALKDKGIDPARMEMGTNLSLWNLPSGLVAYWPFDGSGSIVNGQTLGLEDQSAFQNNGTASNANGSGMAFVEGKVGNALYLDGIDDWVNFGANDNLNMHTSATVSMWMTSTQDALYQVIGKNNAFFTAGYMGWHISTATTPSDLLFEVQNGTNRWPIRFNTGRLFDWTLITAVKDGNTIHSYKNGVLQTTVAVSGDMTSVYNCLAASFKGTQNFFKGSLDEVRVYSRALSENEIKSLYKSGR